MNLTLEEQEVHLSMSADDPDTWYCYTDYPKWQRRFEAVGAELVRITSDGMGRFYKLRADQVLIRKGKPQRGPLSDAQRAALRRRQIGSKSLDAIVGENALDGQKVETYQDDTALAANAHSA